MMIRRRTEPGPELVTQHRCHRAIVWNGFLVVGSASVAVFAAFDHQRPIMLLAGMNALMSLGAVSKWIGHLRRVRQVGEFIEPACPRLAPAEERRMMRAVLPLVLGSVLFPFALFAYEKGLLAASTGRAAVIGAGLFVLFTFAWFLRGAKQIRSGSASSPQKAQTAHGVVTSETLLPAEPAPAAAHPHWWTESGTRAEMTEPAQQIGGRG